MLHCTYVWLLLSLKLKRAEMILLSQWKINFFSILPGFLRKVVVSNGLCLVRCVEMADGHCVSTCQEQSQVSLYTLSPSFDVDFSWKMVHIRQVSVSSLHTSVLLLNLSCEGFGVTSSVEEASPSEQKLPGSAEADIFRGGLTHFKRYLYLDVLVVIMPVTWK